MNQSFIGEGHDADQLIAFITKGKRRLYSAYGGRKDSLSLPLVFQWRRNIPPGPFTENTFEIREFDTLHQL